MAYQLRSTKADEQWRANFRPHACILTERSVPQPIFVAALFGRLLYVDFDTEGGPDACTARALAAVRERITSTSDNFLHLDLRWFRGQLFYSPDFAVRFDLDGSPKEVSGEAYRQHRAALFLKGGRQIPEGFLSQRFRE